MSKFTNERRSQYKYAKCAALRRSVSKYTFAKIKRGESLFSVHAHDQRPNPVLCFKKKNLKYF